MIYLETKYSEGCSRETLEIMYGPVLEVISSCIRHFVHDVEPEVSEQEIYKNFQGLREAAMIQ